MHPNTNTIKCLWNLCWEYLDNLCMFVLLAACYFILEALQETQFLGINHNGWHRSFLSYTTTTIIIVCLMMLMISSFIIHYIRLFPQIGPRWKRLKHKLMFCYGINCQRCGVIINLLTFYWTLTGASAFLSSTAIKIWPLRWELLSIIFVSLWEKSNIINYDMESEYRKNANKSRGS